jgi:hypothetical protein
MPAFLCYCNGRLVQWKEVQVGVVARGGVPVNDSGSGSPKHLGPLQAAGVKQQLAACWWALVQLTLLSS